MRIRARMCTSADGYVSTPDGWPAQLGDPDWDPETFGFVDDDPARLLDRVRAANGGGDVHLIGGPRTLETYRALGALDELGLIVLPILLGGGMQLTPAFATDAKLELSATRALPTGAVEITYALRP